MTTPAAERFAQIFANIPKPKRPDPTQPHIADTEFARPESPRPKSPEHYKIPVKPQKKRKFLKENRQSARDIISSSEDEDDYVNSFKNKAKPEMLGPSKYEGGRKPCQIAGVRSGNDKSAQIDSSAVPASTKHPEDVNDGDMKFKFPAADVDGNKATGHFCIFSLVSKFPYKYMKDPADQVSKRFFAANKFYAREWDIYYIQPPETSHGQDIILLPVDQVQHLLNEISSAFKIDVKLPPAPFTISFFDDMTPQPVLLGKTRSRDEYNEMVTTIPPMPEGHGECTVMAPNKDKRALKDFKLKCEAAGAAKKKSKTGKQAKHLMQKLIAQRQGSSGIRCLQCFVGLRPIFPARLSEPDTSQPLNPQSPWQDYQAEQIHKNGISTKNFDCTKLVQFPFYKNVIFIAFDVEANEHAHHLITEIGVSTLDMQEIMKIAPGPSGLEWIKRIRSRHFRINERKHMRNKTFVHGNPDGFHFGDSQFVLLKDAADYVDDCFEHPFSNGKQHDGIRGLSDRELPHDGPEIRNIVIVGHDIDQDIEYLSKLGSKIFTPHSDVCPPAPKHRVWESIVEALDVATLYKAFKKEYQPRSLGSVMADLGRDAWGLHNGGNDARYTLEALIALAIKSSEEDEKLHLEEYEKKERVAKQVEEMNNAWASQGDPNALTSPFEVLLAGTDSNKIALTNRTWARRDADPKDPRNPPGPRVEGKEVVAEKKLEEKLFANTDSKEEAEALNAKFLDPARTADVLGKNPASGRHYGSDDELDELEEENEPEAPDEEDEESEFEM